MAKRHNNYNDYYLSEEEKEQIKQAQIEQYKKEKELLRNAIKENQFFNEKYPQSENIEEISLKNFEKILPKIFAKNLNIDSCAEKIENINNQLKERNVDINQLNIDNLSQNELIDNNFKQQVISQFLGNPQNQSSILDIQLNQEKIDNCFNDIIKIINEYNNLPQITNDKLNKEKNFFIENGLKRVIHNFIEDNKDGIIENLTLKEQQKLEKLNQEKQEQAEKLEQEKQEQLEQLKENRINYDKQLAKDIMNMANKKNNPDSKFKNLFKEPVKIKDIVKEPEVNTFMAKYKDFLMNQPEIKKKIENKAHPNFWKKTPIPKLMTMAGFTLLGVSSLTFGVGTIAALSGAVIPSLAYMSVYGLALSGGLIATGVTLTLCKNLCSVVTNLLNPLHQKYTADRPLQLNSTEKFLELDLKDVQKVLQKNYKELEKNNIQSSQNLKNNLEVGKVSKSNFFAYSQELNSNENNKKDIENKSEKFINDFINYKNKLYQQNNIVKPEINSNRFLATGGALTVAGMFSSIPVALAGLCCAGIGVYNKFIKNKDISENLNNNQKENMLLQETLLKNSKEFINEKYLKVEENKNNFNNQNNFNKNKSLIPSY